MTKVVLLLGAGATVADVATKPRKERPPLDRLFFVEARQTHRADVDAVGRYLAETYELNILSPPNDRLEGVMALIYTDLYNEALAGDALRAFRRLLQLFNRRLALTTNGIDATNKRLVYRMITHYLGAGVKPEDLTVVTFNQDIQIEKMLSLMSSVDRWKAIHDQVYAFPGMYGFASTIGTTNPPAGLAAFERGGDPDACIRVLKLHGSLNWFSKHASSTPSRQAMFNPSRTISITRRREIQPTMTLQSTQRQMYTLPVVVPPVSHKSSVLHKSMGHLWHTAEQRLRDANELVIFGYSCPATDFESSNQLRRAQRGTTGRANIHVVDPSSAVAERYISLLEARRLHYYASGHDFLRGAAS